MLSNKEGQKVPTATFHTRQGDSWVNISSEDFFAGRTIVVFSLPGAFTPTCSSSHVPRYNQLAPEFKRHGVDEVVCISVNDAFVMNRWQEDQQASRLTFLPDGTGEFTRGMGMLVNKDELGFGQRSWRYSMLVRDGIVEKMFIEPEKPGDPFEVSDADTMLNYIAPESKTPPDVSLSTRRGCPYCSKAKTLLQDAGLEYEELTLGEDYSDRSLRAICRSSSFPQVFVNGERIGGCEELEQWLTSRRAA